MEEAVRVTPALLDALADAGVPESGVEALLPAEKGIHRGVLALCADRAVFVSERFGKTALEGEYAFGETEQASAEKRILGWEVRFRLGGREERIARLSEQDARTLVEHMSRTAPASEPAPAPSPPPEEPGEVIPLAGRESAVEPEDEEAPLSERQVLIRALSDPPDLCPAGREIVRQVAAMEGPRPGPAEACDVLLAFQAKVRAGEETDLYRNPFGMKLLEPLVVLLEGPGEASGLRRLAARGFADFLVKRLLPYLGYHALREQDPEVASLLCRTLAGIGGEAASRTLVKAALLDREPQRGTAVETLAGTAWVPAVPILAGQIGDLSAGPSRALAGACASILALPPSGEGGASLEPGRRAEDFLGFWEGFSDASPLDLVKGSIELNLQALRSSDPVRREEARKNLETLTGADPRDEVRIRELAGEDVSLAWTLWWAENMGRSPETWLTADYAEGLKIPVPGARSPAAPREPATAPAKARSVSYPEVAVGALAAGTLGGALFWFLVEGPGLSFQAQPVLGPVLLWMGTAAAGGLSIRRPAWAAGLLPWGVVAGFLAFLFQGVIGLGAFFHLSLPFAVLGAGFFKTRGSEFGVLLGGLTGLVTVGAVGSLLGEVTLGLPAFTHFGVLATVFWAVQFVPLAKSGVPEAGEA